MKNGSYVSPQFGLNAFNCPFCGAYSHQRWYEIIYRIGRYEFDMYELEDDRIPLIIDRDTVETMSRHIMAFSECYSCKGTSTWEHGLMVHPNNYVAEPPNADMPEDMQSLYHEARSIARLSPKSAAALLRLCLEKLLIHIGARKGTIDNMIQDLINKEVITPSGSVRKALDSIRLIGNAGVHPTEINLDEDPKSAFALFKVINFVVEKTITDEKAIEEIYAFVPKEKRDRIDEKRNKTLDK